MAIRSLGKSELELSTLEEILKEGSRLVQEGNFTDAIETYESLLDSNWSLLAKFKVNQTYRRLGAFLSDPANAIEKPADEALKERTSEAALRALKNYEKVLRGLVWVQENTHRHLQDGLLSAIDRLQKKIACAKEITDETGRTTLIREGGQIFDEYKKGHSELPEEPPKEELYRLHKLLIDANQKFQRALDLNRDSPCIAEKQEIAQHLLKIEERIDKFFLRVLSDLSIKKRVHLARIQLIITEWLRNYRMSNSPFFPIIKDIQNQSVEAFRLLNRLDSLWETIAETKVRIQAPDRHLNYEDVKKLRKECKKLFSDAELQDKMLSLTPNGLSRFKEKVSAQFLIEAESSFCLPRGDVPNYKLSRHRPIRKEEVIEWLDAILQEETVRDLKDQLRVHKELIVND